MLDHIKRPNRVDPLEQEMGERLWKRRLNFVKNHYEAMHLQVSCQSLFMLASALTGLEHRQAAYAHAIHHGYRFYSYGDASLLLPERSYR